MSARLLLILTMLAGLGLGLGYAWLIEPVKITESSPASVVTSYRHEWLIMAAEAYAQDGNWERTRARIDSLRDPNLVKTILDLFDQSSAQGPNSIARALAQLADRMNVRTAAMLVYLATPGVTPTPLPTAARPATHTPSPTLTQTPSPTSEPPTPTSTPTFVPAASPYQLISRSAECGPENAPPQIRVVVQDYEGGGIPGVEVWITWDSGADRFVTGLKPEINPGYGDFDMQLDQTYSVSLEKPTAILVSNLRATACSDGRTSWRLVFQAPAPTPTPTATPTPEASPSTTLSPLASPSFASPTPSSGG